ncbi:MAG: group III truncated hemoglobin [Flavisolibacter sp.]
MEPTQDIMTVEDIKLFVDGFYEKVRQDELLAPVFNEKIQNWPQHLEKMYAFWQTVLFGKPAYKGSPFPPHAKLPINYIHFTKWIELFVSTIDKLFIGNKARETKWRAEKMAEMFQNKIEYYRTQGSSPLV